MGKKKDAPEAVEVEEPKKKRGKIRKLFRLAMFVGAVSALLKNDKVKEMMGKKDDFEPWDPPGPDEFKSDG